MKRLRLILLAAIFWLPIEAPALNDQWLLDDQAWLKQRIAQIETQLAPLQKLKAERDAAVSKGDSRKGDAKTVASVARWEGAKLRSENLERQLKETRGSLNEVEKRIHKLEGKG